MANTEARRGLVNPRLITGGTPHTETRAVSSTYAKSFYPGQLVNVAANGFVEQKITDADESFLGVCMSYLPAPSGAPASQTDEVQVVTDMRNTVWDIQMSSSTVGQTIIGMNVSMADIGTSNTTSKQARMYAGTPVLANHPWKIVGFATDPDNESGNANPRIRVILNEATGAATTYHHYADPGGE